MSQPYFFIFFSFSFFRHLFKPVSFKLKNFSQATTKINHILNHLRLLSYLTDVISDFLLRKNYKGISISVLFYFLLFVFLSLSLSLSLLVLGIFLPFVLFLFLSLSLSLSFCPILVFKKYSKNNQSQRKKEE